MSNLARLRGTTEEVPLYMIHDCPKGISTIAEVQNVRPVLRRDHQVDCLERIEGLPKVHGLTAQKFATVTW